MKFVELEMYLTIYKPLSEFQLRCGQSFGRLQSNILVLRLKFPIFEIIYLVAVWVAPFPAPNFPHLCKLCQRWLSFSASV